MNKLVPVLLLVCVTIAFGGWTKLSDITTVDKAIKDGGCLTTQGTFLYAFQGGNTPYFYAYDPSGLTWSRKLDIPYTFKPNGKPNKKNVKVGGDVAALGTFIYAFKGGNTGEFWAYNTADNTWAQKASVPDNKKVKHGGSLVTVGDYIYAFIGNNTKDFYMYDPAANTWTLKAPVNAATKPIKGGGTLVNYEGMVYAFIGNNTYDFFKYDPNTNIWTKMADAKFGADSLKKRIKDGACLTVLGDNIYAFKGGNTQSFGYYTQLSNTWSTSDTIPIGILKKRVKQGGALVTYDGVIYAFKGGNTKEFWKYTP